MIYQNVVTGSMLIICTLEDIADRRIRSSILILFAILIFSGKPENILAGSVPGICCLFLSRLSHQQFGYGDSLIILLCGISLGITQGFRIVMNAFFLSGIWAVLCLIRRQAERNGEMPFVPFLFAGWLQTVLITY